MKFKIPIVDMESLWLNIKDWLEPATFFPARRAAISTFRGTGELGAYAQTPQILLPMERRKGAALIIRAINVIDIQFGEGTYNPKLGPSVIFPASATQFYYYEIPYGYTGGVFAHFNSGDAVSTINVTEVV